MPRTLAILATMFAAFAVAAPAFAAEDPLSPRYQNEAQKKYFAEHMSMFMALDKNSDGMLSPEEWLNEGNPLQPGFEQDAKYKAKYFTWKEMDKTGRGKVSMEEFMAYMDTQNPLSPNYKKH